MQKSIFCRITFDQKLFLLKKTSDRPQNFNNFQILPTNLLANLSINGHFWQGQKFDQKFFFLFFQKAIIIPNIYQLKL